MVTSRVVFVVTGWGGKVGLLAMKSCALSPVLLTRRSASPFATPGCGVSSLRCASLPQPTVLIISSSSLMSCTNPLLLARVIRCSWSGLGQSGWSFSSSNPSSAAKYVLLDWMVPVSVWSCSLTVVAMRQSSTLIGWSPVFSSRTYSPPRWCSTGS